MPKTVCYLLALCVFAGVCFPAFAGEDPCDEGRGDGPLRCSEKRLAEAKKEMSKTLGELKKSLDPRLVKTLGASQKQWQSYVNTYCDVAGNPFPNSPKDTSDQIYWQDASYNYCQMRLTKERNTNLVRLLACVKEGGSENCS